MTRQKHDQRRKGAAHVLEAIIAAFILLLFVLSTTTLADPGPEDRAETINTQMENILRSLDMNGSLREDAERRDLATIRSAVAQYVPDRTVEIALQGLNTTTADVSFTNQHTAGFAVTDAVERERLRVWYRNATAPNVSVNGQYLANHTGLLQDRYATYRITDATTTGGNTLRFNTAGPATIGYSIDRYTHHQTGRPPADRNVFTTSYLVSGGNTTFAPVEVTVISWY